MSVQTRTNYRFVSTSPRGVEYVHTCQGMECADKVERGLLRQGHRVSMTHINGYDVRDLGRALQ